MSRKGIVCEKRGKAQLGFETSAKNSAKILAAVKMNDSEKAFMNDTRVL